METKEIFQLIENLKSTDYVHVEIQQNGTHVLLSKTPIAAAVSQPVVQTIAQPAVSAQASVSAPVIVNQLDEVKANESEVKPVVTTQNLHSVKSPIVGTFYQSSTPDAPAFVKVGDQVKKGDILCIIEAMKLMNEIESDADGEIVEICVANEGPVEYGQPLFKLK